MSVTFIPKQYQHEKDSGGISNIMNSDAIKSLMDFLVKNHVEDVYMYAYRSSYLTLTDKNAPEIHEMLLRACDMFGVEKVPELYITRDYEEYVTIGGLSSPFIIISSEYLDKLAKDELWGIIASQTAGIRVGHHTALFLAWALQCVAKQIPGPWLTASGLLINTWKRYRFFTYDRAFLLVTGDVKMTLRNILKGGLPAEILDNFNAGEDDDRYIRQVKRYLEMSAVDSAVKRGTEILSDEAMLPDRYAEIIKFAHSFEEKEADGGGD